MSPDPLAACRSLSKTYVTPSGAIEALRSVDLELEAGRLTAVVGASGSGKSTLLRALAGLDRPTAGELLVAGRDLRTASGAELRRHRRAGVTYVAQRASDNFVPHLSLRDHAEDAPADSFRLLEEFGVGHRLDAKPIELSGGEQARAAFALALARATPLVVVDEPTAELDRPTAALLLDAMRRHTAAGVAFAVATHDQDVTSGADDVVRLERGRVITGMPSQPPTAEAARPPLEEREVLAARGLRKSFRRGGETVAAVRDADLALRPGEVGVLLGRSGSGKSTLLTLLAGWQPPDERRDRVGRAARRPGRVAVGRSSTYLPQRFGLFSELSVRENVEVPGSARGTSRRAAQDGSTSSSPRSASMSWRRASTRRDVDRPAAAGPPLPGRSSCSPPVLLADEPSSHQDAGFRDRRLGADPWARPQPRAPPA